MMYHLSYILTSNMGFREGGGNNPPRVSWCFLEPQQGLGLSRHTFVVFTLKKFRYFWFTLDPYSMCKVVIFVCLFLCSIITQKPLDGFASNGDWEAG